MKLMKFFFAIISVTSFNAMASATLTITSLSGKNMSATFKLNDASFVKDPNRGKNFFTRMVGSGAIDHIQGVELTYSAEDRWDLRDYCEPEQDRQGFVQKIYQNIWGYVLSGSINTTLTMNGVLDESWRTIEWKSGDRVNFNATSYSATSDISIIQSLISASGISKSDFNSSIMSGLDGSKVTLESKDKKGQVVRKPGNPNYYYNIRPIGKRNFQYGPEVSANSKTPVFVILLNDSKELSLSDLISKKDTKITVALPSVRIHNWNLVSRYFTVLQATYLCSHVNDSLEFQCVPNGTSKPKLMTQFHPTEVVNSRPKMTDNQVWYDLK